MFKLGKASKRNLKGVNSMLIAVIERALQISNVDFGIPSTGGVRTAEQQYKLYCNGKSKRDGNIKKSKHQSGNAFDIFAYVDGKASYEVEHLALCATAILQAANELGISVYWGGHWRNFKDMPHFELIK
jgi:peptidoglycan L-alanyl-D-glutamate endopeptidase CwlK